jgi:hypothetical protein
VRDPRQVDEARSGGGQIGGPSPVVNRQTKRPAARGKPTEDIAIDGRESVTTHNRHGSARRPVVSLKYA